MHNPDHPLVGLSKEILSLSVQLFDQLVKSFSVRTELFERNEESRQMELMRGLNELKGESGSDSYTKTGTGSTSDATQRQLLAQALNSTSPNTLRILFQSMRFSKILFIEASTKFVERPSAGLKFLQEKDVLPKPLTPSSVANFLRIAPGLPKDHTGSYLGERGKSEPSFEGDGEVFHQEVLLHYVRSFELVGKSVLDCMRIFLSAFRLPGKLLCMGHSILT